jgi:hypothetical protein
MRAPVLLATLLAGGALALTGCSGASTPAPGPATTTAATGSSTPVSSPYCSAITTVQAGLRTAYGSGFLPSRDVPAVKADFAAARQVAPADLRTDWATVAAFEAKAMTFWRHIGLSAADRTALESGQPDKLSPDGLAKFSSAYVAQFSQGASVPGLQESAQRITDSARSLCHIEIGNWATPGGQ